MRIKKTSPFKIAIALVLVLFMGALVRPNMMSWASKEDKEFMKIFHDLPFMAWRSVSDPVFDYIVSCCEDQDDAIRFLEKNGFKLKIVSGPPEEIERINKAFSQSKKDWPESAQVDFDTFVYGVRGPGLLRFWKLSKYEVHLDIKDGKVLHLTAIADFPLLP